MSHMPGGAGVQVSSPGKYGYLHNGPLV